MKVFQSKHAFEWTIRNDRCEQLMSRNSCSPPWLVIHTFSSTETRSPSGLL